MAMRVEQADEIIGLVRSGRSAHFFNSGYGRWGLELDAGRGLFRLYREDWSMNVFEPRAEERWLAEPELRSELIASYDFGQLRDRLLEPPDP